MNTDSLKSTQVDTFVITMSTIHLRIAKSYRKRFNNLGK